MSLGNLDSGLIFENKQQAVWDECEIHKLTGEHFSYR